MSVAAGIGVGLGSMPGTSPTESLSIIAGETPELIFLPELPSRGPGAEMIGRTFSALNAADVALAVDTTPSGWQVSRGEPAVLRRGKAWLAEDLDALEALTAGSTSPVKLQLTGPFTLAAAVQPVAGDRLLTDAGAIRDLAAGLAEGAKSQLTRLRALAPAAQYIVQIDEPSLSAVLAGRVKTRTGRGSLPPTDLPFARQILQELAAAIHAQSAETWLHCCAATAPVAALSGSGFSGWSLPLAALSKVPPDQIADHLDRQGLLVIGFAPAGPEPVTAARRAVGEFASRIGLPTAQLPQFVSVSHECGLAFSRNPAADLGFVAKLGRSLWDEE